jgi:hypothetical protein
MALVYARTDNLLRGIDLYAIDFLTGAKVFLTGAATVQITTVVNAQGVELAGDDWPRACTYIAGSQGRFLGLFRNELAWTPGQEWYAHLSADAGADQHHEWILPLQVLAHTV